MTDRSLGNQVEREDHQSSLGAQKVPILVFLLLSLMILVPIELSIRAGSLFLPLYRALAFLLTFYVIFKFFEQRKQLRIFDNLILIQGFWFLACEILKRGSAGFEPGVSYFVETVTPYFVIRFLLKSPGQLFAFPNLVFILMIPAILLAFPEAVILQERFVHDIARSISGYYYWIQEDYRLGMLRAASIFEHPILYGLFCSSMISLVFATAKTNVSGVFKSAVLAFGCILSASSAPILTMIIQLAFLVGERCSRFLQHRAMLLIGSCAFVFTALSFLSNRGPIGIIATSLALNPQSGYYRIHIWENGIDDVLANPFIGIRPEEWTRPGWMSPSIDNNWLLVAMKGGFPGIILILMILYLIMRKLYAHDKVSQRLDGLRQALCFTFISLFLAGATVAFFGKMLPFFFILLGYGGAVAHYIMSTSDQDVTSAEDEAPAKRVRRAQYTRKRSKPQLTKT
ncbi:O-antigen ligase family protein [Roseibium sp. MMSF_3412]|uniref:O-antigen ligase family protein n=1 Tax=Roseibium sp. MMSF_3412 TaxID=3046712 RepID=UPI00273E7214|nr:O-antigen ligase family protein [Roseibium sp. MMSF_3412]